MITGAAKVTVVGRALLVTVGRADAGIHIENDLDRRPAVVNPVDPKPGQVGKGGEVLVLGQQLGLEAAHLAGRCAAALDGLSADDPPHRRIAPQPVGVVHVLISGETSIDGLTQQSDNVVPAVLARPAVSQDIARQGGEAKDIIEFPIGEQTGVRRDP